MAMEYSDCPSTKGGDNYLSVTGDGRRAHAARAAKVSLFSLTPCRTSADDKAGAFRVGTRDELVTAIGLATQVDQPTATSVWDLAEAWGPVEDLLR